ncbi:MAG: hypothetical protein QW505_06435 [Thermoplasmata archaeon]
MIAEKSSPGTRKKIVIIVIALILICSGLFAGWYFFIKPWDIKQLAASIIDPNDYSPGFSEDLAGRTVQVSGRLTNITIHNTTQGPLSAICLDNYYWFQLMLWGDLSNDLGKNILVDVSFEWSKFNNVTKVRSPQVFFPPGNGAILSVGVYVEAINSVKGGFITISSLGSSTVRIKLEDLKYPSELALTNCSLRVGMRDGTREYIDLLGYYDNNPEIDRIQNLSLYHVGENGLLKYNDSNHNGLLDSGDYLDVEGLTYPNTDSGAQTYLLIIARKIDPCPIDDPIILGYIVLFKNGPIRIVDGNAPYSRMTQEFTPDGGLRLKVAYVSREAKLQDFDEIFFMNIGGTFGRWEFKYCGKYTNLSGSIGSPPYKLDLLFSFVDVQNNGLFDIDDYLIIRPTNGTHFLNSSEVSALYGPTTDIDVNNIFYKIEMNYRFPEGSVVCEYFRLE